MLKFSRKKEHTAILCPNCKKLISRDELICPFCNTSNPGSFMKNNPWTQSQNSPKVVVDTIVYINVGLYILSLLLDPASIKLTPQLLSLLSPSSNILGCMGSTGTIPVFGYHRWWTLIAANYLHGGILHIFFNMMAFRQISPFVFREFGYHRTIIIYTLTGVLGMLLSSLAGVRFTIGASASLCGFIGVIFYYGLSRGGVYGKAITRQVGSWMLSLVLFGFFIPGINNWAHGGGIVSGFLLGYLLGYNEKRMETLFHKTLAGFLVFLTIGTLIWSVMSGIVWGVTLASHGGIRLG